MRQARSGAGCGEAIERVVLAGDQRCEGLGLRALLADRNTILAVPGHVEDRAELALQLERLSDAALTAGVVDARR